MDSIQDVQARSRSFQGYLLVSDLDGTLLDTGHNISEQNINAIYAFIQGGGRFTLATGRGRISVWPYLSKIPINAPCILYNGALIYDSVNGTFVKRYCFDAEIIPILELLHEQYPGLGIEIFLEDSVLFYSENLWTKFHQERDGFSSEIIDSLRMSQAWYKIVLTWDPAQLQTIEQAFRHQLSGYNFNFSEPHFLDITPLQASKGHALHDLAQLMKIQPELTIAIGDNYNDIDMIRKAGKGFAVANACPEVKQAADAICKSNDQHALWDVVTRLVNWTKKIENPVSSSDTAEHLGL
ncbi:MAG: Cof-type HAD-IIB family hydrolase [Eubacteriales bacterium]|nr:Cof-type HAD-IIB family hydrolase [Eubacteriales bacterium]